MGDFSNLKPTGPTIFGFGRRKVHVTRRLIGTFGHAFTPAGYLDSSVFLVDGKRSNVTNERLFQRIHMKLVLI